MNIKEIEARINSNEQSIAVLNDLKVYINYLIQEGANPQVELFLNRAIKLAGDLQLPQEEGALLIELGVHYWNQLDYKSALNMFRLSCGIFKQSKNQYDLVVATRNVGETYTKIGDYNNAISFLKLSLDFLGKVKEHNSQEVDDLCAEINSSLGTAYRKCKSYALSMSAYFRALELQEKHNLKHKICNTNLNIGKMFVDIGNFERALKYFNKAIELSLITNDILLKSQTHALIGKLYRKNGKFAKAIPYYLDALAYLQQIDNKQLYNIIRIHYELALTYLKLEEYEKLMDICKDALKLLENTELNIFKGKIKFIYGKTLAMIKDYDKAKEVLYSALEDIATEDTTNSLKYKILQTISGIYEKLNNYNQAYRTLTDSNNYIDLMIQEKQDKALLELEARFESQQKVREEIMLKKANQEVLELKEKVSNLSNLLEDYQEINSFFGVIPKEKVLELIAKKKGLRTQNGDDITTVQLKLTADREVSQELITRILNDISKLVMFYIRNKDEIGHWGSDSLILILSDMKSDAVEKVIEKIKLPIYNDILKKEKEAKFDMTFDLLD